MKNVDDENLILSISYMLPCISELFNNEVRFMLTDREKIIKITKFGVGDGGNYGEGDNIPHDIPAYLCMQQGKTVAKDLPKEYFGMAIKAVASPIRNKDGQIIGSIAIGKRNWGEDIKEHSKTFVQSFSEISKVIDNVASGIQSVAKNSNDILQEINATNEDMKKTDEIIGFVQNVSKQTNLLGLNAAIESARAGEMGKGFSVVANEIRKLSNSSSESIGEINNVLTKLKTSIENVTTSISENNSAFETQAASVEEINSSISELSNTAQIIQKIGEKL
ncbi:chemotaxis protein [Clostridium sp. P21]|uniref:Chemotaxis protein n=1 Tax=Clostridium muellerianum TaxID=2716538 RepID=A0A7Y0EM40_9CLOT|nr:methyl-accepting chemotaxis protein [Clostridium muellerianum]NMM65993.1 chemotaxis protein [Clostridium muellerianum]